MSTLLLLNDKSDGEAELAHALAVVQVKLIAAGQPWSVVTARAAIAAYEQQVGGVIRGFRWNDWVQHAAVTYAGFLRFGSQCTGKATAQIVTTALAMHKPVVFLTVDGPPQSVVGVHVVNADDYAAGWLLVTG